MGIVENSFKRELGKNAGKMVSNMIFGDKHSTPYRRVSSSKKELPPPPPPRPALTHRATKVEIQRDIEIARINAEREIQREFKKKEEENQKTQKIKELQTEIRGALSINSDEPTTDIINELISIIETKKWYPKKKKDDIIFKSDEEEQEKQRIENQLSDIYLSKLTTCINNSESLITNENLKYYNKILDKFEKRRLQEIYGAIGSLGFFTKKVSKTIINKFNNSKSSVSNESPDSSDVSNEEANLVGEDDSMFFDLNENNRISDALANIWTKYADSVDKEIIGRKPIFSADGVKDSILFVGINPSYEAADDDVFLKSDDEKSLLYGSLYQRDDAPDYFKSLEAFSERVESGYTHTNLLYARENNRDYLLRTNSDFIREQLELTYDTIVQIQPLAIFFFGAICRDLIFGADRWVNPNTEKDGHFILNGTRIPVFLTEDVAFLNESDKDKLIDKIRLAL